MYVSEPIKASASFRISHGCHHLQSIKAEAGVRMQENKEGDDLSEIKPQQVQRKPLRDRQARQRREFEQLQFERLRRQGSDRFWRLCQGYAGSRFHSDE